MSPPAFPDGVIADARDAAKAYLRITLDDEDALIARFAASALAVGEAFLDRALIRRDFACILPAAMAWTMLPAWPVVAIGAVQGVAGDGAAFDLPADAYAIDIDADGTGWVRLARRDTAAGLQIGLTAGIAMEWDGLLAPVAQGVVRLIAHFHGERDGLDGAPPAAVTALWRPYRRARLREPVRC